MKLILIAIVLSTLVNASKYVFTISSDKGHISIINTNTDSIDRILSSSIQETPTDWAYNEVVGKQDKLRVFAIMNNFTENNSSIIAIDGDNDKLIGVYSSIINPGGILFVDLTLSSDEMYLYALTSNKIFVFDTESFNLIDTYQFDTAFNYPAARGITVSKDGTKAFLGCDEGAFIQFDFASRTVDKYIASSTYFMTGGITVSEDEKFAYTFGGYKINKINLSSYTITDTYNEDNSYSSAIISGNKLYYTDKYRAKVTDIDTKTTSTIAIFDSVITKTYLSNDKSKLFFYSGASKKVYIYDINTTTITKTLTTAPITINNFNNTGTITIVSSSGTPYDVEAINPEMLGANASEFPAGAFRFKIPAEEATVSITFTGVDLNNTKYMKYGPQTSGGAVDEWYDFSSQGTWVHNDDDSWTWTMTLRDNQLGDDTGDDGIIVDDAGVQIISAAPPASTVSVPLSSSAKLLLALLFAIGGVMMLQYRKRAINK